MDVSGRLEDIRALADQVQSGRDDITRVIDAVDAIARRQTLLLILAVAAVVLAGTAALGVFLA